MGGNFKLGGEGRAFSEGLWGCALGSVAFMGAPPPYGGGYERAGCYACGFGRPFVAFGDPDNELSGLPDAGALCGGGYTRAGSYACGFGRPFVAFGDPDNELSGLPDAFALCGGGYTRAGSCACGFGRPFVAFGDPDNELSGLPDAFALCGGGCGRVFELCILLSVGRISAREWDQAAGFAAD